MFIVAVGPADFAKFRGAISAGTHVVTERRKLIDGAPHTQTTIRALKADGSDRRMVERASDPGDEAQDSERIVGIPVLAVRLV